MKLQQAARPAARVGVANALVAIAAAIDRNSESLNRLRRAAHGLDREERRIEVERMRRQTLGMVAADEKRLSRKQNRRSP